MVVFGDAGGTDGRVSMRVYLRTLLARLGANARPAEAIAPDILWFIAARARLFPPLLSFSMSFRTLLAETRFAIAIIT